MTIVGVSRWQVDRVFLHRNPPEGMGCMGGRILEVARMSTEFVSPDFELAPKATGLRHVNKMVCLVWGHITFVMIHDY